jgi:hypothetical protein
MYRSALFSALAAAGLAIPATTANAAPPVVLYPSVAPVYCPLAPICQRWTVLYRTCNWEPWRTYNTYTKQYGADRAVNYLRLRGFQVFVSVG